MASICLGLNVLMPGWYCSRPCYCWQNTPSYIIQPRWHQDCINLHGAWGVSLGDVHLMLPPTPGSCPLLWPPTCEHGQRSLPNGTVTAPIRSPAVTRGICHMSRYSMKGKQSKPFNSTAALLGPVLRKVPRKRPVYCKMKSRNVFSSTHASKVN